MSHTENENVQRFTFTIEHEGQARFLLHPIIDGKYLPQIRIISAQVGHYLLSGRDYKLKGGWFILTEFCPLISVGETITVAAEIDESLKVFTEVGTV